MSGSSREFVGPGTSYHWAAQNRATRSRRDLKSTTRSHAQPASRHKFSCAGAGAGLRPGDEPCDRESESAKHSSSASDVQHSNLPVLNIFQVNAYQPACSLSTLFYTNARASRGFLTSNSDSSGRLIHFAVCAADIFLLT